MAPRVFSSRADRTGEVNHVSILKACSRSLTCQAAGVPIRSLHDVEHIVRGIGRVSQLRAGKLDVSRRKVRLETLEYKESKGTTRTLAAAACRRTLFVL